MTGAGPEADGLLCGWRVASDIPLPELPPWRGEDRPADLTVRLGAVPERLAAGRALGGFLQIDDAGTVLLAVPQVGHFLVPRSGDITLAPALGAGDSELRTFLLGTVLGCVCHQRGLLPLHGSCVEIDGGAVAFCGVSGMGKSTLALHFARRGHAVIADDVCVVETDGVPRVRPAFARLKLWRDALEAAALSPEGLERNRRGLDKYHYRTNAPDAGATPALRAVVFLRHPAHGEEEGLAPISAPFEQLSALEADIFRPRIGAAMGRAATLFQARAAVANQVPLYRLTRRPDGPPERWLDAIEALVLG